MSSAEGSSIAPVYTSKWRDTVKDLVAGAVGGVAQVVIGKLYTHDCYIREPRVYLQGYRTAIW